ncbi:hypothetical protein JOL79_16055 [Microbispora sp. RL4-1S]|uniref:Uncharacterized protein n=1 Tax=Microbispora oryzae TaxID=2806554 RepID=A0A940WPU6_9ACTN|nr:hypothetical protein [Microbispora oryzae]MBP2705330.1 hypothetical protein [Microbispora oryzae]
MIALARFRLVGYIASHRALQPFIGLLPLLAIMYATPVPAGQELGAMADSAGMLIPVFAWGARGLLDREPDEQRMISLVATGRGELFSGLLAAYAYAGVLASISLIALVTRLSADPTAGMLAIGVLLHVFSITAGVALGALTSRPILPSPAVSTIALIVGYLVTLMVSTSTSVGQWLAVPVMAWMRDAHHGLLTDRLPLLSVQSLLWPVVGIAAYAWLRRTRP